MSQPYIGEIRMFAGNFAPVGWNLCDGTILPIEEYSPLFNLIGTTYGGNGQTNFALPDLRSRVPLHQGAGYVLSANGGVETVTLITAQLPVHNHPAIASSAAASQSSPANGSWTSNTSLKTFAPAPNSTMAEILGPSGGNQPHDNMLPYLGLNFIISLLGVFPTQ